ncbi:MAG: SOS response-associated peptidase [Desulfotomaculaceae bacterium]|nr:SOS response-associated peptidase [Desulfotomaculaceae bacterium]
MCGRFTLATDLATLKGVFYLQNNIFDYIPRYNIAPSQIILAITGGLEDRMPNRMRWGLIPHWSQETKTSYKMFNARAETIDSKPAFRESFHQRRCLIPADGFYEWVNKGGRKQPVRITIPGKPVFAFAGIWDSWLAPTGEKINSCSIITTTASKTFRAIHERMPVILAHEQEHRNWLDYNRGDALKSLLQPYNGEMEVYPVPLLVNSPKLDEPALIARLNDKD